MPRAVLGPFESITITGVDARAFLQAQLAADIRKLLPGTWQWNAWLTPQGRVRALMQLVDTGLGDLLAVLRGGNAAVVGEDLARYVLRMRVSLASRTLQGYAAASQPGFAATTDNGLRLGFGDRSLRLGTDIATPDAEACQRWRRADIRAGLPTLPIDAPPFLPEALGLPRLGAVALDKGCYPGQEIVARLQYRGRHAYQLCHLHGAAPLARGAIRADDRAALYVLDSVTDRGGTEALVVASATTVNEINILRNTYKVVSVFTM